MSGTAIRRLLVLLDGSPLAERALRHAAAVAKAFGAEIVLLRVVAGERRSGRHAVDSAEWRLRRKEAETYLNVLAARLREQGFSVTVEVAEGNVEEEVLEVCSRPGLDLLVLTSHGWGGPSEFALGGTAAKIVTRVRLSVLLVREALEERLEPDFKEMRYARVVVPFDGSQRAEWGLSLATGLARSQGSELVVTHVVPHPQLPGRMPCPPDLARAAQKLVAAHRKAAEEILADVVAKLESQGMAARKAIVESPHVTRALCDLVAREGADLVVLSAHGASGASEWPYGSVCSHFIAHGTTPVLVFQDQPRHEPGETLFESEAASRAPGG